MSSSQQMDGLFKVVDLSMDVPLAPFYLRDPCQGVNIKLEQAVMKYITKLGGVLLAWWGLRFKDASAGIMWELPEIHTSVDLQVLLFAPKLHQNLTGTINSIGDDYVSLTVLNTFKAQIRGREIPAGWLKEHKIGDEVEFTILAFKNSAGVFTIDGSLKAIKTPTKSKSTRLVKVETPEKPTPSKAEAKKTTSKKSTPKKSTEEDTPKKNTTPKKSTPKKSTEEVKEAQKKTAKVEKTAEKPVSVKVEKTTEKPVKVETPEKSTPSKAEAKKTTSKKSTSKKSTPKKSTEEDTTKTTPSKSDSAPKKVTKSPAKGTTSKSSTPTKSTSTTPAKSTTSKSSSKSSTPKSTPSKSSTESKGKTTTPTSTKKRSRSDADESNGGTTKRVKTK